MSERRPTERSGLVLSNPGREVPKNSRKVFAGRSALLLAAAVLSLALAGCTDANTSPGVRGDNGIRRRIWTDPATGCQFHFWESGVGSNYSMALAPRLGPDRLPVCGTGRM
ncbi:hypothetical protein HNR00_003616 [Methylorubrum rhodinum]|uniref:Uncharacterized protein n=1 Tax=Methylorubrum rhodinum TaxID=29428 RepID=A0A840ZLI6_9HYPH|nr:hypothetical protein [Methylorubrum rhodinum]MBB5758889.1 hypothetical protein [Methylorubrum rhodinum]